MAETDIKVNNRLLSLDFYWGLNMFLLIAEFSHLFTYIVAHELQGSIIHIICEHFHNVVW
mgnify:CR=1 FL=1